MTTIKGLIGFTKDNSFISKAIRFFRKSEYSHCFIIVDNLISKTIVGEAMEFGVRLEPLSKYLKKGTTLELWNVDIDPITKVEGLKKIMTLVGRTYGYLQLIGFVWIWLWNKFGIKKDNPFKGGIIYSTCIGPARIWRKDCRLCKSFTVL